MNTTAVSYHAEAGIAVVQLSTGVHDTLDYRSIGTAIREERIEVREVNDAGSVNSLLVLNHADVPIFLMDGDILIGAKQNRVINTSILLAPQSKTIIPVSCVEQGRWRSTSPTFSSSDYTAPTSLRSAKSKQVNDSLRSIHLHQSDQGEVWDRVSVLNSLHDVQSPTQSLSDAFTTREKEFDTFIASFEAHPEANGLAVFNSGGMLCLDVFNRRDVHREYFKKILRGVAMEVSQLAKGKAPAGEAEASYKAIDFIDTFETAEHETFNGVGLGVEKRFDTGERAGFGLFHLDQLVHLTTLQMDSRRPPARKRRPPLE